MIAISLHNVTLVLGAKTIFNSLNWEIQYEQKIGLIGPNGAGKSSLVKLITGQYQAEPGGNVVKAKGVTIGYLPQQPEFDPEKTALALSLEGNPRIAEIEQDLHEIELKMGDPTVYNDHLKLDKAITTQQSLLDEFHSLNGAFYTSRVRTLLVGLGLPESDFEKKISVLSGGQKKLIGLARLILLQPSVLLLDEPDNHLDIPAKGFLEQVIRNYPGAVVLISHDRYILDAVATHIVEIEDGQLAEFPGNYTDFVIDKEQRLARQEELFQIQQRAIVRMELALKRYQLWVKFSDTFATRVRSMQSRLERVDELNRPNLEKRQMGLDLGGWRGSNNVLEFKNIGKAFDVRQILNNTNFLIRHGERVGLIGSNGAGKSVLLRLILNLETQDFGEIIIGPSVKIGYYAQEHETLDFSQTPLEVVRRTGNLTESNAIAFLVRYLFSYQQATTKIDSLSGGERSRLQLALLVLSGTNFLLLDEPTNNLDIAAAEVLENALSDFVGTVFVISHDRYFLDRTVNRIFSLENGNLKEYIGGYSDFLEQKMRKGT
jgi:ATP-binding cassette subfamily F protein 3